jgi:ABC-2 type transport system permease protein
MYRVELAKALRRPRTWLLAVALCAIPIVIVTALRLNPIRAGSSSGDTPFLFPILSNGLFAALSGLSVIQPYLLPLVVGMLAGDSIAGEAQAGTLRALLVRPVTRGRLVLAKYASAMTLVTGLVALTLVAGVLAGGWAFGLGPLPSLSGTTLSEGTALARILASGAFMVAVVSGVASVGVWISTKTDNGPAAAIATAVIAVVSQILDRIPSLVRIRGYLPTHGWLGFVGFFRFPADLQEMARGLEISAAYTVLFLTLAVVGFRRRDVTS